MGGRIGPDRADAQRVVYVDSCWSVAKIVVNLQQN